MAKLTLQVGAFVAEKSSTDANAARILRGMLAARGYDVDNMTNQEQAEAVMNETVKFYNEAATAQEANNAANEARESVQSDPPTFE